MGAKGFFFILLIYPIIYIVLLVSGLLAYVYNPFLRIGVIVSIAMIYLFYTFRKKYTKRQNDYLENLSLQSGMAGNTEYFYTTDHNQKAKTTTINTYIEGTFGYDFLLKFEGKIDRFFKSIGLSTECQSGDTRFDETVYIVSDDMWLCSQLQTNDELRNLFYDVFWHYHEQKIQLISLRCFDGRIIITASRRSENFDESLIRDYAFSVSEYLQKIRLHLPSNGSISERMYREPTGYVAHVFSVVIFALLANGAISLFADMTTVQILPQLVHSFSVVPLSIKITLVILIFLILAAFLFLRQSSRLSPVVTQIMTLGTLGIFLSSIVEIKEIDTGLDTSPSTVFESRITGKKAVHHRKRGTTYHLYFRSWESGEGTFDLVVPYSLYAKSNEGDFARFYQHKGYLGYPWIENIEILPFTPELAKKDSAVTDRNTNADDHIQSIPDNRFSYFKKLYGDKFERLNIDEKEYLIINYKSMQEVISKELIRYAPSHFPQNFESDETNIIEFYLQPDGSLANIHFIQKSNSAILNEITEETIKLASRKFIHPKQKTLLRYSIHYKVEKKSS